MARTNAEWQELMAELTKMINNPLTPKQHRVKAQKILDGITRTTVVTQAEALRQKEGRKRDSRHMHGQTDMEYDGTIR